MITALNPSNGVILRLWCTEKNMVESTCICETQHEKGKHPFVLFSLTVIHLELMFTSKRFSYCFRIYNQKSGSDFPCNSSKLGRFGINIYRSWWSAIDVYLVTCIKQEQLNSNQKSTSTINLLPTSWFYKLKNARNIK